MSELLSVVVPTYNRALALRRAVDSVLAQVHRDLELIVVDDGSTDGTRELLAGAYGDDKRLRYQYQPHAGAASARNAGLDLAKGGYVAFLDSDDSWKPWHAGLLLAGLDRYPQAGMIWSEAEAVDASGVAVSTSHLKEQWLAYQYFSLDEIFSSSSPLSDLNIDIPRGDLDQRLYVGDAFSPMVMGNLVNMSSVVMRRERLEQVGRFDERLVAGEDYDFYLRACRAGLVAFADIADTRVQVGTHDRLSTYTQLPVARAYLQALDATLSRDAGRITLSPDLISEARARAHRRVGEAALAAGSGDVARAHLRVALRIRPGQLAIIPLIVLTLLPRFVLLQMAGWRKRMKA